MGHIQLYGKNVENYKQLLLRSHSANVAQVSCGASLGQGYNGRGPLTMMAAMSRYGKTFQNLLQNQISPGPTFIFAQIIRDRKSAKIAKMMVLR